MIEWLILKPLQAVGTSYAPVVVAGVGRKAPDEAREAKSGAQNGQVFSCKKSSFSIILRFFRFLSE